MPGFPLGATTVKQYRLAVIGAGSMGSAILRGILEQEIMSPADIWLANPHREKLEPFGDKGVRTTTSNPEAVLQADVVILAVKPQRMEQVAAELAGLCEGKCVVSIAAGISRRWLKERLPGAMVLCVMPNTPLMLGCGACAMTEPEEMPEELFRFVYRLFACAGVVELVREDQMNAVIPVNGSSPAFFFRMARVMTQTAVDSGIDADAAARLTAKTMEGAALMLQHSGKSAQALEDQVCSPGGTTLAALTAFDEMGFEEMMQEAFRRCVRRAEELGR